MSQLQRPTTESVTAGDGVNPGQQAGAPEENHGGIQLLRSVYESDMRRTGAKNTTPRAQTRLGGSPGAPHSKPVSRASVPQPQQPLGFAEAHPGVTLVLQIILIPAFVGVMAWMWVRRVRARLGYRTVVIKRR
jgi:hypothetical protein